MKSNNVLLSQTNSNQEQEDSVFEENRSSINTEVLDDRPSYGKQEQTKKIHKTVTYIIFGCNGLICLLGLIILAFGIWSETSPSHFRSIIGNNEFTKILCLYAITLIIMGVIAFVTGLCGCSGAISANACCITFYFIILVALFVVHIVIGTQLKSGEKALAYSNGTSTFPEIVSKIEWKKERSKSLNQEVALRQKMSLNVSTSEINHIETIHGCCGVNGKPDYNEGLPTPACSANFKKLIDLKNNKKLSQAQLRSYETYKGPVGCLDILWVTYFKEQVKFAYIILILSAFYPLGVLLLMIYCCTYRDRFRRKSGSTEDLNHEENAPIMEADMYNKENKPFLDKPSTSPRISDPNADDDGYCSRPKDTADVYDADRKKQRSLAKEAANHRLRPPIPPKPSPSKVQRKPSNSTGFPKGPPPPPPNQILKLKSSAPPPPPPPKSSIKT